MFGEENFLVEEEEEEGLFFHRFNLSNLDSVPVKGLSSELTCT